MRAYDLTEADDPWAGAVLLHPHPDMGGDRYNNVVSALFEALPAAGVTALRFDFKSSDLEVAAAQTVEALGLLKMRIDDLPPGDTQAPSLFTAVQEQLGLKLESRKAPVEIIVVDSAERVPTGN